jgi:hypothetical protein
MHQLMQRLHFEKKTTFANLVKVEHMFVSWLGSGSEEVLQLLDHYRYVTQTA